MSKIVTQDKLNELTGMSIDYGKGGGGGGLLSSLPNHS